MKYTFEFKLKAVKHYLENGSYLYPSDCASRKQKHTFRNHVKFWKSKYLTMGEKGLRHKENKDVYSPERKLQMIGPIMRMGISATKQSRILGVDQGTLVSWIKRYKLLGMDGLKCSKRGRPPKNMPEKKEATTQAKSVTADVTDSEYVQQLLERISQLEQRNRDLEHKDILSQAEIDYLKKLHALAETKRKSETRKKHGSSKSSAKAEDTKED